MSIRGSDTRNPVLLYVHGGPGYISVPMNWWFANGWQDYFTVVNWDQRGSGKTYLINDPKAVAPTMTPERMQADTEEMTKWLSKMQIFLLGHSWGSYLGLKMAVHHPAQLYAYIGVARSQSRKRAPRLADDARRRASCRQCASRARSGGPRPLSCEGPADPAQGHPCRTEMATISAA
ncbi:MAG TPA: alpha/beta fold hydrolase [Rhizomicrobium sp.]|nr:alpha/beta fold hydrolase [Rhizomicrobium sp.]